MPVSGSGDAAAPIVNIETLRVSGLRNLHGFEIALAPGLNLLLGPNGAGKTSVLEAVTLLARGRSFRGGGISALMARDATALSVFARVRRGESQVRLGLGRERGGGGWEARVDGERAPGLAALARHLPFAVFEPDSHALIEGGPDPRRRLLDWVMFHVEPALVDQWRRYHRALRQRNELLKQRAPDRDFAAWEKLMADSGTELHRWRQGESKTFGTMVANRMSELSPALGNVRLRYRTGWDGGAPLLEALADSRKEDRRAGYTRVGPHRFDLVLMDDDGVLNRRLSRGQQKVAALAFTLSQALMLTQMTGVTPMLALDDVGSELDETHQTAAIEAARAMGAQTLMTSVDPLPDLGEAAVFHVEHHNGTDA